MFILCQPFLICQPGSPVATSLCEGEAIPKHVGILNIRPDNKVSKQMGININTQQSQPTKAGHLLLLHSCDGKPVNGQIDKRNFSAQYKAKNDYNSLLALFTF